MPELYWNTSHAVFIDEIDDEHKEIFDALCQLRKALASRDALLEIRRLARRLTDNITGHFRHEERLMRAARYGSFRWHKQQHDTAARRVRQFVTGIERREADAGTQLVLFLSSWLHNHTRVADRMLGAFLRNHRRTGKVTIRFSTKPAGSCTWVDANGNPITAARDSDKS